VAEIDQGTAPAGAADHHGGYQPNHHGFFRAQELPPGMTQTVLIDITGQDVSAGTRSAITRAIEARSLGAIKADNIDFFTRR